MTLFLGLTQLNEIPNRRDTVNQQVNRSTFRINSTTGAFTEYDKALIGRQVRTFDWYMPNRTSINAYRAFMAERQGRLVPFWVPTWHHDLKMSADVLTLTNTIHIVNFGYTQHLFDSTFTFRRYLAFILLGKGVQFIKRIDACAEVGTEETITFDSNLPYPTFDRTQWMLSFLTLCRLENDNNKLHWATTGVAEASFDMREVPQEMPLVPV